MVLDHQDVDSQIQPPTRTTAIPRPLRPIRATRAYPVDDHGPGSAGTVVVG